MVPQGLITGIFWEAHLVVVKSRGGSVKGMVLDNIYCQVVMTISIERGYDHGQGPLKLFQGVDRAVGVVKFAGIKATSTCVVANVFRH